MIADDVPLVRQETAGHEADKLLRTVVRAFYDDTCSIVLDIVLRNHYETKEKDIMGICKNVNPQTVREALSKLQKGGLLETDVRQPYWVAASKYQARQGPRYTGFTRFHYDLQRKQHTEEQDFEERKERKVETFYYVDYTKAIGRIRYRLFKLLSDGTEAYSSTLSAAQKACAERHFAERNKGTPDYYACSRGDACPQHYTPEEAMRYMNMATAMLVCPACGSKLVRIKGTASANAKSKEAKENEEAAARARYREALQPLIDVLAVVMRNTYSSFKKYSPEEEKLQNELKRKEEEEKRRSAGYVDDVVIVEESLGPPPGVLDESSRARNGAIPWLVRSTFFDDDYDGSSTGAPTAVHRDAWSAAATAAAEPAAKRARSEEAVTTAVTTAAAANAATGAVNSNKEDDEEDAEARMAMAAFDRQLQELLDATSVPESEAEDGDDDDDDTVLESDAGSAHSTTSSTASGDASAAPSPVLPAVPQSSPSPPLDLAQRVCRGFDADVLGARVVTVRGVPCALRALTLGDLRAMSDAEYSQYAHTIAEIAGVY